MRLQMWTYYPPWCSWSWIAIKKSSISPVKCEISHTVNSAIMLVMKACYENSNLFQCLVFIWKQCEHNVSLLRNTRCRWKTTPSWPKSSRNIQNMYPQDSYLKCLPATLVHFMQWATHWHLMLQLSIQFQ